MTLRKTLIFETAVWDQTMLCGCSSHNSCGEKEKNVLALSLIFKARIFISNGE